MPKSSTTLTAHITTKNVAKLVRENKPPAGSPDRFLWDEAQPGFGIRLTSSYASFCVRTAKARSSLGDALTTPVAEARDKAAEYSRLAKISGGGIDVRKREIERHREERNAIKLGALVDIYLEARKDDMRPRSWEEIERQLRRRDWKPLHGRAANSIGRADIIDRVNEIARDSGRVAADRARTALSGLYAWAINGGGYHSPTNPCIGVQALSSSQRERTLSESELREIWLASDPAVARDHGRIVRLLILTGQRKSEVGGLRWDELVTNCAGEQVELPANRMKNGRPHVVPLAPEALECLPPKPNKRRTFVFGRDRSGFRDWSGSKRELDTRILEARRNADPKKAAPMPPWVLHDLRRSFSTRMREERIADPHLIELILCHVSGLRGGVAGVYDRSERLEERRTALETWGRYIAKLVAPRQEAMAA